MTPTDLAAALLADVPRHTIRPYVDDLPCLLEKDVLAALSCALDPALLERAGEVLEGVSDAPWRVGHLESYEMSGLAFRRVYFPTASEGEIHEAHIRGEDCDENARFIAWCREGVPALLAQIAVLLAERDGWKQWSENWRDSAQRCLAVAEKQEARATAAEAKVEKLRAERDASNEIGRAFEEDAGQQRARAEAAEAKVEKLRGALTNLPAVYAHQINTGVREVYDPLQRFYTMESVLAAITEATQ